MNPVHRSRITVGLIFLAALASRPVFAQATFAQESPVDLTGTWRWINQEDERDRAPGAYPGDYRGLPLNDAARMRADTYDEEWNSTSPLMQCRSRGPTYQPKALDAMRIDKEVDPITRQLVAYRASYWKTPGTWPVIINLPGVRTIGDPNGHPLAPYSGIVHESPNDSISRHFPN